MISWLIFDVSVCMRKRIADRFVVFISAPEMPIWIKFVEIGLLCKYPLCRMAFHHCLCNTNGIFFWHIDPSVHMGSAKPHWSELETKCLELFETVCACVYCRSEEHTSELQSQFHLVC